MVKKKISNDELFLVRLNVDELHYVGIAAQADEMMAIKYGRPKENVDVCRSVLRKTLESIGRKYWPATAYAEVPVHG